MKLVYQEIRSSYAERISTFKAWLLLIALLGAGYIGECILAYRMGDQSFVGLSRNELLKMGALNLDSVLRGEWYRTVLSIFIHSYVGDLIVSLGLTLSFGALAFLIMGGEVALTIFFFSALLSNFVQLFSSSAAAISCGAQVGLIGLFSAAPVCEKRNHRLIIRILLGLLSGSIYATAFWFVTPTLIRRTLVTHVAAIIIGVILGNLCIPMMEDPSRQRRQRLHFAFLIAVLLVGISVVAQVIKV